MEPDDRNVIFANPVELGPAGNRTDTLGLHLQGFDDGHQWDDVGFIADFNELAVEYCQGQRQADGQGAPLAFLGAHLHVAAEIPDITFHPVHAEQLR